MPRLSKIGAAALAAFGWTSGGGVTTVTASYLQVAGGGGGGNPNIGGGGGGGGYLTGTTTLNPTLSYTVIVGAGGAAATNGSNSQFGSLTASIGGGHGGTNATAGGSGGGGGSGASGNTTAGSGTSGQGNNGGAGSASAPNYGSGGGGGASAVGGAGTSTTPGNGGNGTASSISGTSVTYAGGGGGGTYYYSGTVPIQGFGGTGGGGNGGLPATAGSNGFAGTANTGGGGGGCSLYDNGTGGTFGGNGGSGIVIISYAGAQQFGGGIVTSVGGNTIHTFQTSGTLSPLSSLSASYLIVGGGGGAGTQSAGGGGAGGMLTGSGVTIDTNSTYLVTVGSGGAGAPAGTSGACVAGVNGTNSTFSMVSTTVLGGGGGGSYRVAGGLAGATGGSGGGGAIPLGAGGAGTSGQGFAGGQGGTDTNNNLDVGGGGGGAGAAGVSYNDANTAIRGDGGVGVSSSITGTATYYAGGGGGATHNGTRPGTGGLGGGGNGANTNLNGSNGTANTGGGGGGGSEWSNTGGSGGSGIVIIAYAGSTQQMAGGTVTIVGGNVIHTFTSSGYLTPLTYYSNSLRFRSSASAYLNRTPTATGSAQKFTWSGWIKRGKLSTTSYIYVSDTSGAAIIFWVVFNSSDQLQILINGSGASLVSNAVYRDPAAWYHIQVSVDTTQATTANRILVYVNGSQVTSFSTTNYYSLNDNIRINAPAYPSQMMAYSTGSVYTDGYLTNINFIDGQQLTANSFGTFNSYGVWQPINYGGSYGTNGFYLPFTNKTSTTTLGYDFSPQGNNWTTNNISVTAGSTYDSMTDVPTLTSATAANYAVLNPLQPAFADTSGFSITNGNLYASGTGGLSTATMGVSSGKFYAEIYPTGANAANGFIGIWQPPFTYSANSYSSSNTNYRYYGANGNIYNTAGSIIATYATWGAGDVIGIALDMDNGTLKYYKNNTLQGTAVTGLTGTWLISYLVFGSSAASVNFGQQPFVYTPPTGFVALNTYNL